MAIQPDSRSKTTTAMEIILILPARNSADFQAIFWCWF